MTELEQLARWRTIGARHSDQVLEMAPRILKARRYGDQEWAVREQLAIAALDLGQFTLATEQLELLLKRFPGSPRVKILLGLRLEARGQLDDARELYEDLLAEDETNISAHQRLIAMSTQHAPIDKTIGHILAYLDTFYSDPSGWSLLAELYADQGMYAQSLTALGHLIVLQTWDSDAVRRAGETAYTLGDYQLALKHYLRASEMETDPVHLDVSKSSTRTWWGIKLIQAHSQCTRRLLATPQQSNSVVPETMYTTSSQLRALDELATERVLAAGGVGQDARRRVLGATVSVR